MKKDPTVKTTSRAKKTEAPVAAKAAAKPNGAKKAAEAVKAAAPAVAARPAPAAAPQAPAARPAAPAPAPAAPAPAPVVAQAPAAPEPMERPAPIRIDWELGAPLWAVSLVEKSEHNQPHFRDEVLPNLKNFVRHGKSSLTPYEIGKLAEGLLGATVATKTNGTFVAGDRVKIAVRKDGGQYESQGFVFSADTQKRDVKLLAVDDKEQFVQWVTGEKVQVVAIVASALDI